MQNLGVIVLINNETEKTDKTVLAVIMPVYIGEKYIEQAVYSVLNQPCKDLIIIIVNDGSTDNTKEILRELNNEDDRLIILEQSNKGLAVARNSAIEYCNSFLNPKYIAFLDSDDAWVKNFYTEDLKKCILEDNKDFYRFEYFYSDQKLLRGKLVSSYTEKDDCSIVQRSFINQLFWSYIYSNEVIKKYGIRFPEGITAEDYAFQYLFYSFSTSCKSIKKQMYVYRNNDNSITHKKKFPFEIFFNNKIPGWVYVVNNIEEKQGRKEHIIDAKSMIKIDLVKYIMSALAQGVKKQEVKKCLNNCKYSIYLSDDKIWIDNKHEKIYKEFLKSPNKLCIKLRMKQFLLSFAKKFRNTKIVIRMRYPIDVSDLV